jgi:hypothetical protein
MSSWKSVAMLPLALALVLPLAGCAGGDDAEELTPPDESSPVVTPTPSETAAKLSFTLPDSCLTVLPDSRLDAFDEAGLVLLGGPDGKYGDEYLVDRTPEQRAGGITCIWGFAEGEMSSVTISIAPLSTETRPDVVDSFTEQGLNEDVVGGASVFGVEGDRELSPAILNALRPESWISVIQTIGGPEAYAEAVAMADEIYAQVYQPE